MSQKIEKIFDIITGHTYSREIFRDDDREIESKCWFTNGQVSFEQLTRDGKLEGMSRVWYENGQLWEQAFYRNDHMEGEHKYWNSSGNLTEHVFYQNNGVIFSCHKFKSRFLRVKRFLTNHQSNVDSFLVSDLARIAYL